MEQKQLSNKIQENWEKVKISWNDTLSKIYEKNQIPKLEEIASNIEKSHELIEEISQNTIRNAKGL